MQALNNELIASVSSFSYGGDDELDETTSRGDIETGKEEVKVEDFALQETRNVRIWRTIIHTLFGVVLAVAAALIFVLATGSDQNGVLTTALASTLAGLFLLTAIAFFVYDKCNQRKNEKILKSAEKSNALVSNMFPAKIHEQLFSNSVNTESSSGTENESNPERVTRRELFKKTNSLRSFFHVDGQQDKENSAAEQYKTTRLGKPIAELYPETTIMILDLVGFTAWSSVREPSQVFMLLETIFQSFDEIAKKRRVWKLETVGDSYVAVTGLPDYRKQHAVDMARFATDCLRQFQKTVIRLERSLGPDTSQLGVRIGLNSGPITGGILRGERSRFQLFGDTINTAARMESNSVKGKIQLSQTTADLLIAAGKGHWLTAREDKIMAKGKGAMQTYWLQVLSAGSILGSALDSDEDLNLDGFAEVAEEEEESLSGNALFEDAKKAKALSGKMERLVDWNTECLLQLLQKIVERREANKTQQAGSETEDFEFARPDGAMVIDEVKEFIRLPGLNAEAEKNRHVHVEVELDPKVGEQLREYITSICCMYRDNPFHNFEHASHVTMSVLKLLSRIVSPLDVVARNGAIERRVGASARNLHDHTYGITSDPLTQFACVFAGIIHDVDHEGVSNAQLIKENKEIAVIYQNKSVAEQNSVDLAFDLLMINKFADLQAAIFATKAEMQHFRQVVVNSVMATDIMDKELKKNRDLRWDKVFAVKAEDDVDEAAEDTVSRKATIVIEHLIQASDVSHTMQHWHVYRKWNERLFKELFQAWKAGRSETDPSKNWYQGELNFFDFYVIPLAKKLEECGVFGVSSAEYLNYARGNRQEWADKGEELVEEMREKCEADLFAEFMQQHQGAPEDDSVDLFSLM